MNRIVLIGNGFDLAHGLKTSYADFIYWYWKQRVRNLYEMNSKWSDDNLCKLTILTDITWSTFVFYNNQYLRNSEGKKIYNDLRDNKEDFKIEFTQFFERIHKSIETKGWVDIENDYYELLKKYALENASEAQIDDLNTQLYDLQVLLVEYLKSIEISDKLIKSDIRQKIYAPFKIQDVSIESQQALKEHVEYGLNLDNKSLDSKFRQYGGHCYTSGFVDDYRVKYGNNILKDDELPPELLLPNNIMLLNFNYTHTAQLYLKEGSIFSVNQIHGDLKEPKSVIFGYGDELDDDYKTIVNKNENKFLGNIKSIKYLEADNYRRLLSFVESEPYQIIIMGHSCGNSDRTLLNTLFEHKNCVSIKPYYHQIDEEHDDYIKIVQNISRNYTDMKLMRDRVVNKTYCEPLTNRTNDIKQ
jgi:hypothetical protein